MASQQQRQQQPRRWFSLGSLIRPASPLPSAAAAPPPSGLRPRLLGAAPPAPSVTTAGPLFPARPLQPTAVPKCPAASSPPAPSTTLAIVSSPLSAPTNSPVKKRASPNPSPPPPSAQPSRSAVSTAIVTNRGQTQVSSPRTSNTTWSKTPPQPPQLKPIITQTKAAENNHWPNTPAEDDQKTVLVHEAPAKEDVHRKLFDSKEFVTEIVRLAGENKGAAMGLSASGNKGNAAEERSNIKERSHKSNMEKQSSPSKKKILVNSNVQGVNNSIACNSCFKHHDPGVHISFYKYGNGGRGLPLKSRIEDQV